MDPQAFQVKAIYIASKRHSGGRAPVVDMVSGRLGPGKTLLTDDSN
jgi:hypothetical protein